MHADLNVKENNDKKIGSFWLHVATAFVLLCMKLETDIGDLTWEKVS